MQRLSKQNLKSGQTYEFPRDIYTAEESISYALPRYCSNNDFAVRKTIFYANSIQNTVIDFHGSELLLHGRLTPFLLENCDGITIKNLTVRYDRPFYSQGTVVACDENSFVLSFPEKYPLRVQNGEIEFYAENWSVNAKDGYVLMQEFDTETRAPAYNKGWVLAVIGPQTNPQENAPGKIHRLYAEQTENGYVRFTGDIFPVSVGNELVITHEKRSNSIFTCYESRNLKFENVTVLHSGAMGWVFQCCENIDLNRVVVKAEDGFVSTNCDATHFVNCSGKISITESVFESMMDDAVNIHGIYTTVEKVIDNELLLRLNHYQQYGVNVYFAGDKITVYKKNTLRTKQILTVESSRLEDEKHICIKVREEIACISAGDYVENKERMPQVYIDSCLTGKNRPRGFLLNSGKKTVVRNCRFYNSMYAIHIAGDNAYWFESGGVEDVLIQNNTFEICGYQGTDFVVAIAPEILSKNGEYYHRNIRIEDNTFIVFTDGGVYARNTENLIVRRNTIIPSNKYKKRIDSDFVVCEGCRNVKLDNNILKEY